MNRLAPALLLVALLAGCATVPGATPGGNGATAHSAIVPAPLVNVSSTHTSRETSIAVSPANDQDVFLCAPSGVPAAQNGESYFFVSRDGGATWTEIKVETSPTDPRQATFEGGDCDVAYDAAGTMYAADISLASVSMGASRDGGKTWSGTPVGGSSPVADRPWLVGGPAGTVYMTYQDVQFGTPTMIWFVKSTDYGATYSRAVPVVTPDSSNPYTWEGNLVVSPDGKDLAQAYNRRNTGAGSLPTDQQAEDVFVATSHDGGATWTQHLASHRPDSASYLYPSLARDAAGGLHLVFAQKDGDKGQPVWYAYSGDKGATWTKPIPLSHGVGYSPWVAATPEGTAVVQWLGSPQPNATLSDDNDWFTYVALVRGHGEDVTLSTSTAAPIFHGKMGGWPEFNMVRLDAHGRILLGESVPTNTKSGVTYTEVFQRLAAPGP
jgi:hypothetical protein